MVGLIVGGAIWASVTLAPNYTPVDHFVAEWTRTVQEEGLTAYHIDSYQDFIEEVMPDENVQGPISRIPVEQPPPPRVISFPQGVEQWRTLVEAYFQPEDVAWAMRVMACESGGNPYAKNPRSTASGLFQFLRGWWSGSWGYPAFDPFDPEANVKAAAWLYYNGGPQHWVCK